MDMGAYSGQDGRSDERSSWYNTHGMREDKYWNVTLEQLLNELDGQDE
jgi:hypothetical protein